jgi:hypothetical protein
MRKLTELYQLVYQRLETKEEAFVCNCAESLLLKGIITDKEKTKLINHFKSNKPSDLKHTSFYKHLNRNDGCAWWPIYSNQRLLFIEKMIKITNKKNKLKPINNG